MARKKLAIWQLVIAGVILAGGIVAFALYLSTSLAAIGDGMKRMAVPGDAVLDLEPGTYTVFHEFVSDYGGTRTALPRTTHLDVKITDDHGDPLALRPVAAAVTYETGGREAVGLYHFTTPAKGRFTVKVEGPRTVVAVGKSVDGAIVRTTFVSFTILLSAILASLGLVAFTLLRWAFSKA